MFMGPEDILNCWFYDIGPARWFADDPDLDAELREKFLAPHEAAAREELSEWEKTPEGVIALLLLLDYFPRRMFRGTARAFETDEPALDLARRSIIQHFDDRIDKNFKLFFYLPFSHSENNSDQRLALFYIRERTKESSWIERAQRNQDVIERFGRFPQRNEPLGRESTEEEKAFLASAAPEETA